MGLAEKIRERELEPHHIFLASFLAGLNEMGMLNQASVNVAGRRAGRYLAEYVKAQGDLPEPAGTIVETAQRYVAHLDSLLRLGTRIEIGGDGKTTWCRVASNGCRFCPKGVGEAELEGTICPYPGMIEEFVNQLLPDGQKVSLVMTNRRPLVKDGGDCLVRLE